MVSAVDENIENIATDPISQEIYNGPDSLPEFLIVIDNKLRFDGHLNGLELVLEPLLPHLLKEGDFPDLPAHTLKFGPTLPELLLQLIIPAIDLHDLIGELLVLVPELFIFCDEADLAHIIRHLLIILEHPLR